MARRQQIIKKKVKKLRITKTEAYMTNLKFLGDEPKFNRELSRLDYMKALNWYNYMCTTQDAREYLETFFLLTERHDDLQKLKNVSDNLIPTTAAWIARMWSKGYDLPESSYEFFNNNIEYTFDLVERLSLEKENQQDQKPVVRNRLKEKQSDLIAEIEEMLDLEVEFSLYDWLKMSQVPVSYMPAIINKYLPVLEELVEAMEGNDEQLVEAYSFLTKEELENKALFFNSLIEDATRYSQVEKKERAPRKVKPISPEKQVKNLKFQKEDNHFNLKSIKPERIIGAKELWTFNTKYKVLTVLRALDEKGLQVKGTSILNYDEKNSMSKKTGRQSEEILARVTTGTQVARVKALNELKTNSQIAQRINENTILLKVV